MVFQDRKEIKIIKCNGLLSSPEAFDIYYNKLLSLNTDHGTRTTATCF